jgi:1-acyl-sn-glycerol-3-phosphate acyltransferase
MTSSSVDGTSAFGEAARRAARAIRTLAVARAPFDPDGFGGRDVELVSDVAPLAHMVSTRYLRSRVEGLSRLPRGPALLVGNHNGGIFGPDLVVTLGALWRALGPSFPLYMLAHDFAMRQFLPLGRVLWRLGALRAAPSNALAVLEAGGHALVYPGGDLDAYRHFRRRNEVVFGERTGFVRVAQRARAPIVPIVAHGAHRSAIIVTEGERFAKLVRLSRWGRLERFPVALAMPWGIALGPWTPYLPLPLPVRVRVLEPIDVDRGEDPARARERVRDRMQRALDEMARESRRAT